jgi:glutamate racemase
MTPRSGDSRPVGVFDSGVGGLTVARALMDLLPDEQVVYLGDSARGPYGPRDQEEVRRFAAENVAYLAERGCKLVVAACNTATAAAFGVAPLAVPVPTVGVIDPAVEVAVRATRNGRIGVIGTVGTVRSGAYERAVARAAPHVSVTSVACPRFVALVEAGRTADALARELAADYLAPLVAAGVDTLVLGCTHYPLLTGVIGYVMGPRVLLVSSAEETARAVFRRLVDDGALAPGPRRPHEFVATGDPRAFGTLATRFLGPRVTAAEIETLAWSTV